MRMCKILTVNVIHIHTRHRIKEITNGNTMNKFNPNCKRVLTTLHVCMLSNAMLNVDFYFRLIDKRFAAVVATVAACRATANHNWLIEHGSNCVFKVDEHFTEFLAVVRWSQNQNCFPSYYCVTMNIHLNIFFKRLFLFFYVYFFFVVLVLLFTTIDYLLLVFVGNALVFIIITITVGCLMVDWCLVCLYKYFVWWCIWLDVRSHHHTTHRITIATTMFYVALTHYQWSVISNCARLL